MGPESSGGQRRPRSKSQILITPSPASSRLVPITASPQSASSPLTHASSQPSLDASSSHGQDPPASSQEKGFTGLPSVRQLAQTFGGKSTSGQSNSTHAATNYRPIIRAKSMAASDVSRRPDMTRSSDSSKVNGVPTMTGIGGRLQGQYVKRTPAPKPPGNSITNTANGQTELERVQARLRATGMSNSNTGMQNGDREVSVFKTNLDRKKSSSSILLGQKTDFDGDGDSRGLGLSVAQPSPEPQLGTMRRAQSREELYAIESRTRVQKDAMLKEIGNRKAATTAADEKESYTPITGQWGLKGSNLLAQRLQQGKWIVVLELCCAVCVWFMWCVLGLFVFFRSCLSCWLAGLFCCCCCCYFFLFYFSPLFSFPVFAGFFLWVLYVFVCLVCFTVFTGITWHNIGILIQVMYLAANK